MSVAQFQTWRLPGCGDGCIPRRHDPADHERYGFERGYAQAVEDMRPRRVDVGCLSVDLASGTATVDDERVPLTPREYELLALLAANVGRPLDTPRITAAIWGDVRERVAGHHVRVNMSRLRAKLGPAAGLIAHDLGYGYVLRAGQRDAFGLPMRRVP